MREMPPIHPADDDHRLFAFTLERIVFFSDAVFAIAITLLAIEVRLPDLPPGQTDASFLGALAAIGPTFFAFVLSFLVIAAFWVGHYRTFRYVVDADGRLVAINFAFLFCIAILPFPTSIIAREGNLSSATVVYAVFGLATGALSTLLWVYPASIAHLTAPEVTPEIARYITYRASVIPVIFAVSIPVALVAPALAWVLWFSSAAIQGLVTRRYRTTGVIGLGGAGRTRRPAGQLPLDPPNRPPSSPSTAPTSAVPPEPAPPAPAAPASPPSSPPSPPSPPAA
jgi:uncharacterized membrane protein